MVFVFSIFGICSNLWFACRSRTLIYKPQPVCEHKEYEFEGSSPLMQSSPTTHNIYEKKMCTTQKFDVGIYSRVTPKLRIMELLSFASMLMFQSSPRSSRRSGSERSRPNCIFCQHPVNFVRKLVNNNFDSSSLQPTVGLYLQEYSLIVQLP